MYIAVLLQNMLCRCLQCISQLNDMFTHFQRNVSTKVFIIPLETLPGECNTQLIVQSSKHLLNRDYNQSSFSSDYMLSTSGLSRTSSGEL